MLYLGYFTLMESRKGQTLGKMLLKLQTQGPDGAIPTTEQALQAQRLGGARILGVIPVLGGLVGQPRSSSLLVIAIAVTINSSPTKQGWHDKLRRRHAGSSRSAAVPGTQEPAHPRVATSGVCRSARPGAPRRNRSSSGPAVPEPESPTSTNTATARSPCTAIIQACVCSGSSLAELGGAGLGQHRRAGHVGQERARCRWVTTPRISPRSCRGLGRGQRLRRRRRRRPAGRAAAGGPRREPFATDAATAAIAIGEAVTRPWPISEAACPVSEPASSSVAGTYPKYAGKPRSWSTPRPRDAAAVARARPASTVSRSPMKAVLQEFATARAQRDPADAAGRVVVVVLEPSCRPRPWSRGQYIGLDGGRAPARSSARLLTTLNVEPGGVLADGRGRQPAAAGAAGDRQHVAGRGPDRDQRAGRARRRTAPAPPSVCRREVEGGGERLARLRVDA